MSKNITYYIDTFDTSLLDNVEKAMLGELLKKYPKRLSLIKLIQHHRHCSYHLSELKQLVNEYDINIEGYE